MAEKGEYIPLSKLEVYQLARELSKTGWQIYQELEWQDRKSMGDQFIRATDSVGANIAEGYRRFHYLERIKFYYNARASLAESNDHWLELLHERKKVAGNSYEQFRSTARKLEVKLNNFIASTSRARAKQ